MKIQSHYTPQTLQSSVQNTGKFAAQRHAATAQLASFESNLHATVANSLGKVTISSAAEALAEREGNKIPARTLGQQEFLRGISNNIGADAEADLLHYDLLAYEMSHTSSAIVYCIVGNEVFVKNTGKIATAEYLSNFEKEAAIVDAAQRALYNSEKAKGTDPREIIAKLFDLRNSQSASYLEATRIN